MLTPIMRSCFAKSEVKKAPWSPNPASLIKWSTFHAKSPNLIEYPRRRSRLAEIFGNCMYLNTPLQFLGGGIEASCAEGDENKIASIGRSRPGQFEPYAAIGTGK